MKPTKVSKKTAKKPGKKSNRGPHLTSPLLPADLLAARPNFKPAPDKPPGPAMAFLANVPDDVGFAGPRRIDWRLGGAVPVPGSQGGLNTCTSFAVVSVVETLHFLRHHTRIKLSPGFIHTCLLGLPPELGANPQDAIDVSAAHGIAFGFPGDYPYPTDHCATGTTCTPSVAGRGCPDATLCFKFWPRRDPSSPTCGLMTCLTTSVRARCTPWGLARGGCIRCPSWAMTSMRRTGS